jgi:hypothetical protein
MEYRFHFCSYQDASNNGFGHDRLFIGKGRRVDSIENNESLEVLIEGASKKIWIYYEPGLIYKRAGEGKRGKI